MPLRAHLFHERGRDHVYEPQIGHSAKDKERVSTYVVFLDTKDQQMKIISLSIVSLVSNAMHVLSTLQAKVPEGGAQSFDFRTVIVVARRVAFISTEKSRPDENMLGKDCIENGFAEGKLME